MPGPEGQPRPLFTRHRWSLRLGLAGAALVSALMIAEAFLPDPEPLPARRYVRLREYVPAGQRSYEVPGLDGDEKSSYAVDADANGFIEHRPRFEHPAWEIVFLGGSTTECTLVPVNTRWPAQVRMELHEATGLAVNTYNGGMSGSDAMHSNAALVAKVIPMDPDMVVLMHGVNDLFVLGLTGSYWHDLPSRSLVTTAPRPSAGYRLLREIKNVTFPGIARALSSAAPEFSGRVRERAGLPAMDQDEFATVRHGPRAADPDTIRAAFRSSITQFVVTAEAWNITPVLMTQASRYTVPAPGDLAGDVEKLGQSLGMGYEEFVALHEELNQITRGVAHERGALLVDLAAAIPPEQRWIADAVHLSPDGCLKAARTIAGVLGPVILAAVGPGDPPRPDDGDWTDHPPLE